MENSENKINGLVQSQNSLYTKFKKINRLFKIHFSSLTLLFLLALGYIILWVYLFFTGLTKPELIQRYGLVGTIVTILMISVLSLLIIQIGIQLVLYRLFIIRGQRSLKQNKEYNDTIAITYNRVVPYISNFYAFFKRYAKEKTTMVTLVKTFLFLNFISGFFIVFLITNVLDIGSDNDLVNISMVILFLFLVFFWLVSLMTSFKIQKEVSRWDKLFPKLEEWAQELEEHPHNNSILFDEEVPS